MAEKKEKPRYNAGRRIRWLGVAIVVAVIAYSGGWYPQYGAYLNISGGLSGFDGTANAVYFDEVYLATEAYGSGCPIEPSGMIATQPIDSSS